MAVASTLRLSASLCVALAGVVVTAQGTWPVPDEFRTMRSPLSGSPDVVAAGKTLYDAHCLRCHGARGAGDGPAARAVKPAPTEIASAEAQARMSDGEIFFKITEGRRPMPSMKGSLTDVERWQIVHFVRTLQPQAASAGEPDAGRPFEARQIVERWFARWNALDGSAATADALIALYAPDALHSTAPAAHQMGTVTYRGHDGLRKMLADYTAAYEKPAYRIEAVTAKETTAQLFNTAPGPWGGVSVAVEFAAAQTSRGDGRRWFQPGAAFFQIQPDGRIRRMRVYLAAGEQAEVEPDVPRRRP